MIYRPSTPGGTVIFCEDIRDEIRGLKTYVGCYNVDIITDGNFPAILPKMGFSIRYMETPGESEDPVRITISVPGPPEQELQNIFDFEVIPAGPRPQTPKPDSDDFEIRIIIQVDLIAAPMLLHREGHIRVTAWRGKDEVRLGNLKIRVTDPSFKAGNDVELTPQ